MRCAEDLGGRWPRANCSRFRCARGRDQPLHAAVRPPFRHSRAAARTWPSGGPLPLSVRPSRVCPHLLSVEYLPVPSAGASRASPAPTAAHSEGLYAPSP